MKKISLAEHAKIAEKNIYKGGWMNWLYFFPLLFSVGTLFSGLYDGLHKNNPGVTFIFMLIGLVASAMGTLIGILFRKLFGG